MRPQLPALTSARFFAALFVVIFHYNRKAAIFPSALTDFGYEAVAFFFILSGFILTYTHAAGGKLNVTASHFWLARARRIVPTYLLALILGLPFVIGVVIKNGFDPAFLLVPPMLQSWFPPAALLWNSPAWSLSNEAFFYAVYPAAWLLINAVSLEITLLASAFMIGAAEIARQFGSHNFGAYFPLLNLPQFLLGVVLGRLFLERGKATFSNAIVIITTISLGCILGAKPSHPWIASGLVLCSLFAAMIYALAGCAFMKSRALVIFGDSSYALYLFHVPIWFWWDHEIRVVAGLTLPPPIDFAFYALISIGASVFVTLTLKRLSGHGFRLKLENP